MSRKNEIVAQEVSERKALWASVRRAEPIQQIRRLMRQKELLNRDLAERLGVSEAAVSRLLKGGQNIQVDTLYMLADALEEPLNIQFGDADLDCTYPFESNGSESYFEFENGAEGMRTNVVHMHNFRKYETPKYNTFHLECA